MKASLIDFGLQQIPPKQQLLCRLWRFQHEKLLKSFQLDSIRFSVRLDRRLIITCPQEFED